MTQQGNKYLSDIISSIELIEKFIEGIDTFESYQSDLKTQSAVERQLGIIGEAVNKFDQLFPEETIVTARQIIGFRNRLIHAYDSIDNTIVWTIIKKYLIPLKIDICDRMK